MIYFKILLVYNSISTPAHNKVLSEQTICQDSGLSVLCLAPVSVPVCPYLVLFLSSFSLIISWFPTPVCPSLSCLYKSQSVQFVFVGSAGYVRVFPAIALWMYI